jgi:hypothetical protein
MKTRTKEEREMKRIRRLNEYASECCEAPPLGEIDDYSFPVSGICSCCKEGVVFYLIEEMEE